VYPAAFRYFRAHTLDEAFQMLAVLGEDARPLAGGQSLIPLMKLRFSQPSALVDLQDLSELSQSASSNGTIHFGALATHSEIEESEAASEIPILHDCAAGIADVQVRNRGTIGGSLAEADPTGDWSPVLLALDSEVRCVGAQGERPIPLPEFVLDAYTTVLRPAELIREVIVHRPPSRSGGAYLAFKRCPSVYATVSAAVQLQLGDGDVCEDCRIVLGSVGLTAIRAQQAEAELAGKPLTAREVERAADAAVASTDPQGDLRGSAEYKRVLLRALVRRAVDIAARRARGERVEASHEYIGRS
jgi:carbon-monoxide dehydrogenase medium subunit